MQQPVQDYSQSFRIIESQSKPLMHCEKVCLSASFYVAFAMWPNRNSEKRESNKKSGKNA